MFETEYKFSKLDVISADCGINLPRVERCNNWRTKNGIWLYKYAQGYDVVTQTMDLAVHNSSHLCF